MRGTFFMICQQWAAVNSSISRLFSVVIREKCVLSWCGILKENRVFLYDAYMKYASARKCQRKSRRKFLDERVPSRQTIHNLVNKLRPTRLLIDKKQKHKCRVLTEEKLDDREARLEHTRRKSLKLLAQETGVSRARGAKQLLKLRPYKTTAIHARLAAAWSS
jgi:hypothetical protein